MRRDGKGLTLPPVTVTFSFARSRASLLPRLSQVHTKDLSKFSKKVIADPHALVISCEQDKREWQSLAAAPHHCKIYSVEAILQATLHQDLTRGFIEDNRIDARWEE